MFVRAINAISAILGAAFIVQSKSLFKSMENFQLYWL